MAGHGDANTDSSALETSTSRLLASPRASYYTDLPTLSSRSDNREDGSLVNTDVTASVNTNPLEHLKTITYLNGLALNIGLIIGSGIFASPSEITSKIGSPGGSVLVWILAGLLAWTGASSYAELGSSIPYNGGLSVYLKFIYGELSAFLYTWISVFVLKPVSIGINSIVLSKYALRALIGADFEQLDPVVFRAVAVFSVCIVTALNCVSTKAGTRLADILMWAKFVALSAIISIGFWVLFTRRSGRTGPGTEWMDMNLFIGTSTEISSWILALYAALWAYDGWDLITFVAGEMQNAQRDLPKVIHMTMPLVMACFVFANVAYYIVLPDEVVRTSKTIAINFGRATFGSTGAALFALAVSVSCFGAVNASIISSGRLVHSAARNGYLPEQLGQLGWQFSPQSQLPTREIKTYSKLESILGCFGSPGDLKIGSTPINAMLLLVITTTCYIIVGDFGPLLIFGGIASYAFHFVTVGGLVVLRIRQPSLERPYRTWISSPLTFCVTCIFLVVQGVRKSPASGAALVGISLVGFVVYTFKVRK